MSPAVMPSCAGVAPRTITLLRCIAVSITDGETRLTNEPRPRMLLPFVVRSRTPRWKVSMAEAPATKIEGLRLKMALSYVPSSLVSMQMS